MKTIGTAMVLITGSSSKVFYFSALYLGAVRTSKTKQTTTRLIRSMDNNVLQGFI
jgi:hypothetical protein